MADILHEVTIAVTPQKVYSALTEEKGLAGWWVPDVTARPEVGTVAEFRTPGFVLKFRIDTLEPARKVVWSVVQGVPEWDGTHVTWDLKAAAQGTVVRFGHRGWATAEGTLPRFSVAWAWHFMSLKDYLEKGEGRPGPSPY